MFKSRETLCAFNKEGWEKDKSKFNCRSSINVYHCIQDERNRSGEICIQPVWVKPHYCPEYKTGGLDTVPCNVTTGCPDVRFWSHEAYRYPVCLNKTHVKGSIANNEDSISLLWILVLLLPVIAAIFVLSCYVWRRRQKSHTQKPESDALLEELNKPFHKTKAFYKAVHYLESDGRFLLLTGIWGSGKTETATEVFKAVTGGRLPKLITDLAGFDNISEEVVFDEAIREDISEEKSKLLKEKIRMCNESPAGTQHFIILTSSPYHIESTLALLSSVVINANVKCINLTKSLTSGDRTQILSSHFNRFSPNKDFSKIEHLATRGKNISLGYPEICVLFCRCTDFQKENCTDFCKKPIRILKSYLEKMYLSKNSNNFLLLVYMSLNEMEIDLKSSNEMLFRILNACKIYKHAQKEIPNGEEIEFNESNTDIPSLIPQEFVNKVPNTNKYRLQHEVIKRMCLVVFGTYHFDKLLEFSKRKDLEKLIKERSPTTNHVHRIAIGDILPFLIIGNDKWSLYEKKVLETADN